VPQRHTRVVAVEVEVEAVEEAAAESVERFQSAIFS
jgi:hypothetical protein